MKLKQKSQMTERTKAILKERAKGKSIVEIGKLFGCSRQLVYGKLKRYGDPLDKALDKGVALRENERGGENSKKGRQTNKPIKKQ